MASIEVRSYIDIGTGSVHDATTWQFAKDKDFTKIISQSIKDKKNVKVWHDPLRKRPEDRINPDDETECYTDEDEIWARVKIHCGETTSDWFVVGAASQLEQRVMVTDLTERDEDGKVIKKEYITNSTALGWTTKEFSELDMQDPDILGPLKTPDEIQKEEMERKAYEEAMKIKMEEERLKREQEDREREERKRAKEELVGDISPLGDSDARN